MSVYLNINKHNNIAPTITTKIKESQTNICRFTCLNCRHWALENIANFSVMSVVTVMLPQGRSQPRRSREALAFGGWARGGWVGGWVGVRKCLPSRRGVTQEFFVILSTKSCILMHSLAPKIGTANVFIETLKH